MLTDNEIKDLAQHGMLKDYIPENIDIVSYDLRVNCYCSAENHYMRDCSLKPGESVFVKSVEGIELPNNIAARIHLRNSRIRQGLTLDAPIYYPGHKTIVFFRITNISNAIIHLRAMDSLASITFEKLQTEPLSSYNGTFQGEMDFTGMAGYTDLFRENIEEVNQKKDDIKNIERNIYSNVITIMTVFIGLFSLINVNISLVSNETMITSKLLIFNLTTVGSISFLAAVLRSFFPSNLSKNWIVWCLSIVAFAGAIILQLFI